MTPDPLAPGVSLQDVKLLMEILALALTLVGAPLAVWLFHRDNVKARRQREYETYHSLDERYLRYLELCFENPELDIFDVRHDGAEGASALKRRREQIALTMLISVLERASLLYGIGEGRREGRESKGWCEYIEEFAARENFRDAWSAAKGSQFEERFVAMMDKAIAAAEARVNAAAAVTATRTSAAISLADDVKPAG